MRSAQSTRLTEIKTILFFFLKHYREILSDKTSVSTDKTLVTIAMANAISVALEIHNRSGSYFSGLLSGDMDW